MTVLRKIGRIQFLLADFTGIADHVRGKSILRIETALGLDQLHLGEEIAMRFDEGQFAGREFFFDGDGVVLGARGVASDAGHQVVVIQIQSVGDAAQMFGLQIFTDQDEAIGRMVVDDDAAIAIQDLAAGRRYG